MFRAGVAVLLFLTALTVSAELKFSEDWTAAQAEASRSGKNLAVWVTGSDWAQPSQRLEDEVWAVPSFEKAVADYLFVRLDFPRNRSQPERLRVQNKLWTETYPVEGLPTLYVFAPTGLALGRQTGLVEGGPDAYVALLKTISDRRPGLEALVKAAAQAAPGADRAKAYDALFRQAEAFDLTALYGDLPLKIVQEDRAGTAGLKVRYQTLNAYLRFLASWVDRDDTRAALADLDKLTAQAAPWPDLVQKTLFTKGMILWNALEDEAAAARTLRQARDLLPESAVGRRSAELLDQLP